MNDAYISFISDFVFMITCTTFLNANKIYRMLLFICIKFLPGSSLFVTFASYILQGIKSCCNLCLIHPFYEEENTISHSVSSNWASEYFLSHTFYPMGFKDENEISHSVNSSRDFKILLSRTSYHIRKGSQGWKWNIAFCKYAISHFVNSSKGLQGWKWNITFLNCYCNFFFKFYYT